MLMLGIGGGLARGLNDIAQMAGVGISIHEASIPISEEAKGAYQILALDPHYVAKKISNPVARRLKYLIPIGNIYFIRHGFQECRRNQNRESCLARYHPRDAARRGISFFRGGISTPQVPRYLPAG